MSKEIEQQAVKNLKDFKDIADRHGMRFMLMEGNLLGAYRNGKFCEGDEGDIDLGIMDNEFYKFSDVVQDLLKIGFTEKKLVVVDGVWHGGCWERNGNHIDIMRMLNDGKVYNIGDLGGVRYDYSPDIFDGYSKINFMGIEVETVGNIEKFLEERYGDYEEIIPKNEYCYNDPYYSPNIKFL